MTAEPVLGKVLEQVLQRPLADAPQALRRELEATFPLFDEAGVLEPSCQLLQLGQGLGGLLADEISHAVEVDLRQCPGLRGAREHLLELVELAQALEHVRGLCQP